VEKPNSVIVFGYRVFPWANQSRRRKRHLDRFSSAASGFDGSAFTSTDWCIGSYVVVTSPKVRVDLIQFFHHLVCSDSACRVRMSGISRIVTICSTVHAVYWLRPEATTSIESFVQFGSGTGKVVARQTQFSPANLVHSSLTRPANVFCGFTKSPPFCTLRKSWSFPYTSRSLFYRTSLAYFHSIFHVSRLLS